MKSVSCDFPIVVHSHLRWSFVWQRPQQTHSRLASSHEILFIEEPLWERGEPRLRLSEAWSNVTVAQPILAPELQVRTDEADGMVRRLLEVAVGGPLGSRFTGAVHWLYTPMMEPQVAAFGEPAVVVYDCMDDLTGFMFAPPQLLERERRLLARAHVVFTGGRALHRAKSTLHPNVHFLGCGVDFEHFRRAAAGAEPAPEVAALPSPRLGYMGVIDERLDYGLLAELAEADPGWSLVLLGPIVKVDPSLLPAGANVYALGARPYAELPGYLAGFDVCLMPFALNAATEFINPTKTLEYLATGRPVVSTPVRDVVDNFGDTVNVASRDAFVNAVRRVLGDGRVDPRVGLETARRSSWDRVVSDMEDRVKEAIAWRRDNDPVARWATSA